MNKGNSTNRIGIIILGLVFFASQLFSQANSVPQNIIILIGDGMGVAAVSALVLTDTSKTFQKFTHTGFSITSSKSDLITDSGAGGTAIATGYRTKNSRIGMSLDKKNLKNMLEYASLKNKSTALVVTSSITHATPASFSSHVEKRSLEFDIAQQQAASDITLAIGGGYQYFLPESIKGTRTDTINLINQLKSRNYSVFYSYDELIKHNDNNKIFCFLAPKSLKKASERNYSLGDLTSFAIDKLSKNQQGFVMMVEGSQIDWACHENADNYMYGELWDFLSAVKAALKYAESNKNTLVIVLADHETGGLAIKSGKIDGAKMKYAFSAREHTPALIGVFAYGPGAHKFSGVQNNFEIGRKLIEFIEPSVKW